MEKFYSLIKSKLSLWAGIFWGGTLLLCSAAPSTAQIAPENCDKFLGNIYANSQLTDFTDYWNQVTPENAGKWGIVEGTRDQMNWTTLDAAYAFAKDNGFPFRFHILIWGNQQPSWIETLPAEEQLEEIKEWYAAVAERYPDIDYLEVVNEPTNDPPRKKNSSDQGSGNYIEALGGNGDTGWDWVLESFRLAREYFPETPLVLNDFKVTNTTTNANRYIAIIELLKAEDLIDIVGIQMHAFETYYAPPAETKKNLDAIAATGIPIMITEMDIEGVGPDESASNAKQLAEYQEIFPIIWEHPSVMGVTLWGWRPGLWREKANLVTSNGTERPALVWLKDYLQNRGSQFCGSTTGLKESKLQQEINVYPNPATNGSFTLELTNELYDQVKILDYSGKVLRTINLKGQNVSQLDLDLAPGIYLVQLVNKNVTASKKLVVK